MAISPKLKAVLEAHINDLDILKFDNIVYEAIREDILDELLDAFYKVEVMIPSEVVTKQLYEFYIKRVVKNEEERARYERKLNYLINKHQNVIIQTLDAPKK